MDCDVIPPLSNGRRNSSVLVNYGHQESDGFTIHNASHKDFVNYCREFSAQCKTIISAYIGYSNSYDQRSGELPLHSTIQGIIPATLITLKEMDIAMFMLYEQDRDILYFIS